MLRYHPQLRLEVFMWPQVPVGSPSLSLSIRTGLPVMNADVILLAAKYYHKSRNIKHSSRGAAAHLFSKIMNFDRTLSITCHLRVCFFFFFLCVCDCLSKRWPPPQKRKKEKGTREQGNQGYMVLHFNSKDNDSKHLSVSLFLYFIFYLI